jgi:methylated-DNA-[protein]-cysteine S-methyltransferase
MILIDWLILERAMKQAWFGVRDVSPIGPVWVAVSARGLVAVELGEDQDAIIRIVQRLGFEQISPDAERTAGALEQIVEYLAGKRKSFDLPIDWSVLTSFQSRALRATFEIPYGEVRTYGEIAQGLGKPGAARAVGRAEATNPMPLVIPCHRVIGTDGKLHGYGTGNGLETKAWLLKLERSW